jgi:hypothetical protein
MSEGWAVKQKAAKESCFESFDRFWYMSSSTFEQGRISCGCERRCGGVKFKLHLECSHKRESTPNGGRRTKFSPRYLVLVDA